MQSLFPANPVVFVPVAVFVILAFWRSLQEKPKRKSLPLPPGPAYMPIIGNMLSIDRKQPWKTYTEWHAIYGNVVYNRLLDQDVVVIGSQSVAIELLEKRSSIYSDRPFVASLQPYGIDCIFAFTPYGDHWRSCRRMFHHTYRANTAVNLHQMQLRRARRLIADIIDDPESYEHHYNVFAMAVPLSGSYNYEVDTQDDPIVRVFENYAASATPAATPENAVLLKLFPFLLHVPDWFPGSSIRREATRARDLSIKLTEMPFHYVEERLEAGEHPQSSMIAEHLARMPENADKSQREKYIFDLKKAGVSSVIAGSDTTLSTLMVFTLAMVLNPRVWNCAQAEIDAVIGTARLPNFGDRPYLPYVNAIVRETLRWQPVVPLGVWHATSASDVYKGQYIPKGTTIVANVWAMSRDEARFPNAEDFVPERFLGDDDTLNDNDPADFVFGFGRRICPGRYTADASLFVAITTMLATLEFSPLKDDQGNDMKLHVEWVNGITLHPKSFPCRISPRAHVKKSYLERTFAE